MSCCNRECGVYVPQYYNDFKCKADKCRHNCCIRWEIQIDDESLEKYRALGGDIMESIKLCDDGASFRLREDRSCPHLLGNGLCNIIISKGEDYLCDICKNHPRFINDVGAARIELGLGISCEEACRLVLECDAPFPLVRLADDFDADTDVHSFDALSERDKIISYIIEETEDFENVVEMLRRKYGIPEIRTMDEWCDYLLSLEILDTGWGEILENARSVKCGMSTRDFDKYFLRLLQYFIFRHVSISGSFENLCARLGFSILCAEFLKYLFERGEEKSLSSLSRLARAYSEEIEYSEENTDDLIFEFETII